MFGFHKSPECPARGQRCRNCQTLNHFARWCHSAPAPPATAPSTAPSTPVAIHWVFQPATSFKTCCYVNNNLILLLIDTSLPMVRIWWDWIYFTVSTLDVLFLWHGCPTCHDCLAPCVSCITWRPGTHHWLCTPASWPSYNTGHPTPAEGVSFSP